MVKDRRLILGIVNIRIQRPETAATVLTAFEGLGTSGDLRNRFNVHLRSGERLQWLENPINLVFHENASNIAVHLWARPNLPF
jgi:hypothetical protein